MPGWKEALTHLVHDVETRFDDLKYSLYNRLGGQDPIKIMAYNTFGSQEKLYIKGRVLEDQGISPAMNNDSLWENLLNMYRRFESDEVRYARLVARFQGQEVEVSTGEEGYFELILHPTQPLQPDRMWQTVELELVDPHLPEKTVSNAEVLIPPASAKYMVISDIDDTVLQSDATHLIKMARHVFLSNAHTRLPFPGVAAFYRALFHGVGGEDWNPLFYVSSSPWNLYDLLVDFFSLQNIPIGPVLFLRDWGITETEILPTKNREHKLRNIRRMLDFYPTMPFILIGDSGQEDPEIYAEVVEEYPDRILATYIRNVSRDLKRSEEIQELAKRVIEAGSDLILADDTVVIAEHAIKNGWISAERLPEIKGEKLKDEAPPSPLEKVLGEKEEGPTAVIEVESPAEEEEAKEAVEKGAIEDVVKKAGDQKKEKTPTVIVEADKKKAKDQG